MKKTFLIFIDVVAAIGIIICLFYFLLKEKPDPFDVKIDSNDVVLTFKEPYGTNYIEKGFIIEMGPYDKFNKSPYILVAHNLDNLKYNANKNTYEGSWKDNNITHFYLNSDEQLQHFELGQQVTAFYSGDDFDLPYPLRTSIDKIIIHH